MRPYLALQSLFALASQATSGGGQRHEVRDNTTSPPIPEPVEVTELAIPPSLWSTAEGACSLEVNPSGTGCIYPNTLESGSFTPDGLHVVATANFTGAPAAPDSSSIYTGIQLFLLKADGTVFPNGDAWKCITCGVPAENRVGVTDLAGYPQTFRDGKRVLTGANVVSCGDDHLSSDECTPDKVFIYPLRLSSAEDDDGTGAGLALRELRIHPDNVHITFNSFTATTSGVLAQLAFFGRLAFNATGSRYDLVNVTILSNPNNPGPFSVEGNQLTFNRSSITVGELRGLTGTGDEIVYVGNPWESCNIDLFAVHLTTGAVRRITAHPEYTDPISVSPDDKWQVVLDTRGSDRQEFLAAVRSIPPLTDLVTVSSVSSVRNNGARRFFQPILLDHDGDRESYFGQQLNGAPHEVPGDIGDPNWNAGADPRWSYDGTKVVYYQMLALPPACGGDNPLACEVSPYPDQRARRVMVATLTSRKPLPVVDIPEHSDEVPWGLKYTPGMTIPAFSGLTFATGDYILQGLSSGTANVSVVLDSTGSIFQTVAVNYHNYSDDGLNYIHGSESVAGTTINSTLTLLDWYSNITSTTFDGGIVGTKLTGSGGFQLSVDVLYNFFEANGTLVSTVDGISYYQPCNFC
ncbi:saponin hydrolase precursor [Xylariaceae sp. FL1272]|nr:saponin hydrolase precursor [Xylariaceae sp. FL1272]